jgi:hypothetical protein
LTIAADHGSRACAVDVIMATIRCPGSKDCAAKRGYSAYINAECPFPSMHHQAVMGDTPVCWEGAFSSHQHHIRQCIIEAVLAEVNGWHQGTAGRCGSCSSLC